MANPTEGPQVEWYCYVKGVRHRVVGMLVDRVAVQIVGTPELYVPYTVDKSDCEGIHSLQLYGSGL